jgi:hypothetical protein
MGKLRHIAMQVPDPAKTAGVARPRTWLLPTRKPRCSLEPAGYHYRFKKEY